MANMGFDSTWGDFCLKRKFRWKFFISSVNEGLPCSRGKRPGLNFREIEIQHYNEIIYFPGKPEWKQVDLTLYDRKQGAGLHPVLSWIAFAYSPNEGTWKPSFQDEFRKQDATLQLYDGCGGLIELWQFEGLWPQSVDFGELDMGSAEIVTCDVTLRYDRAFTVLS